MFYFVRPDESFMFGTASGTVDATYDNDWIVDGKSNRPVRNASGLALTITALASRSVGLLALINHNIAGTTAITGGVTATIPAATLRADGIYTNPWVAITPVSASSLVMTVSGIPAIVGELIAGQRRSLEKDLFPNSIFDPGAPFPWEEGSSLPPYDDGVAAPRRLSGETIFTDTGLADLKNWYDSTRRGTRPTLIVPDLDLNDAWLVNFRYAIRTAAQVSLATRVANTNMKSMHRVSLEFVEIPSLRWPA